MTKKISVLIPLYNGEKTVEELFSMIYKQKLKKDEELEVIAVDSTSKDKTLDIVKNKFPEVKVLSIPNKEFDHGGTRNYLASKATGDFLLFMTQDAIPYDEFLIRNLVDGFDEQSVEVCFARQIPYKDANYLEKFARGFNYPDKGIIKNESCLEDLGIKAFFNSNVCSMYRTEIFEKFNGFPEKIILNEDMIFASKVILGGKSVYYKADAKVFHSHNYSFIQQFKRYFDIGMAFEETRYLLEKVSNEKEGIRFLFSMINHLINTNKIYLIPSALIETVAKYAGYILGKQHKIIPLSIKRKLSAYMK